MKIIKDKKIMVDDWRLIREIHDADTLPEDNLILPFTYWQENTDRLIKQNSEHAIWIGSDMKLDDVSDHLQYMTLIALDFPLFKDGRSYTYARLLRDRYGYKGELRAIGDVLRDQLFYMKRCGFDSFEVRADQDAEKALSSLDDFTICYQTAADEMLSISSLR